MENDATNSYTIIICPNCGAVNYVYSFEIVGEKNYCIECSEEL